MPSADNRKFCRIDLTQEAGIKFPGNDYEPCFIQDLSLTGMFVLGNFSSHVGEKCLIKYSQKTASSHLYFKAAAKVVWSGDKGIGIIFTSMPLNSYMLLETTLLYESRNPVSVGLQLPESCPFKIIEKLSEDPEKNI